MEKRFDIIIVSWNRLEYLKRTVASLIVSGAFAVAERVIIVDNGSVEEGVHAFVEDLRLSNQNVFLVLLPNNRGWGHGVNNALGLSRAPYLLLLNNDVEFNVGFHERMITSFENQNNIGILGAWRHTSHGFTKNGVSNEFFREMDDVPAVAWMMHKNAMEKVGMLPEKGTCFTKGGNGEDTEYVQRMKQEGFLVGVTSEDIAYHIDGY